MKYGGKTLFSVLTAGCSITDIFHFSAECALTPIICFNRLKSTVQYYHIATILIIHLLSFFKQKKHTQRGYRFIMKISICYMGLLSSSVSHFSHLTDPSFITPAATHKKALLALILQPTLMFDVRPNCTEHLQVCTV